MRRASLLTFPETPNLQTLRLRQKSNELLRQATFYRLPYRDVVRSVLKVRRFGERQETGASHR